MYANMESVSKVIVVMALAFIFLTYLLLIKKKNSIISILLVGIASSIILNTDTLGNISEGFGRSVGNIGILVLLSYLLFGILKSSKAIDSIGEGLLKVFKKGREELGVALIGSVFSIGLEKEMSYLLLSAPIESMGKVKGKSKKILGLSLGISVLIVSSLLPPTAGPYGVAKLMGIDLLSMIKYGLLISIPMILVAVFYIKKYIKFDEDSINKAEDKKVFSKDKKPGFIISILPIIIPALLVILKIIFVEYDYIGFFVNIVKSLGEPIVAMAISVVLARLILNKYIDNNEDYVSEAIKKSSSIILLIGVSEFLAMVFRATNISEYIGSLFIDYGIPAFILPFIIATFIKFIQGNEIVAMMTTAALISEVGLISNINPIITALSICVGSLFFSYVNDGFFFLVTETLGIYDMKDKIKSWSLLTVIVWIVGFLSLVVLNIFI